MFLRKNIGEASAEVILMNTNNMFFMENWRK